MKVPLSWLAEFVDVDLTPDRLAERLTLLGMEVRAIERRGEAWNNVVVGELLSVDRHPRADRLWLTRVTIGSGEPLDIVCGATNIAPGQRVPVALPGAVLPGNRRIERTEKMGVVSNGMLCSGDELQLTGDADGILILDPDTALGASLAALYGDTVLDIDVKPNRGDALSILGLAREVAAITGTTVRMPDIVVPESAERVEDHLGVSVEDRALCSRFVGRWAEGIRVGPSPDRIQMRLLAAGLRPVSNVVDASNYVMIELGKPIHTFDAAAVQDGRIEVRLARAGERLITLDHVDRALDPDTLLIADRAGPLGIAGVMGGATSEVSETTTSVIIESAIFDPISIRRTAFRYALRSEASLRFEKGQEVRLARIGADRTAQLIAAWAGARIARGRIDTAPDEPPAERVVFRPARASRLTGLALEASEQIAALARVGIEIEPPSAGQTATAVPVAGGTRPLAVETPAAAVLVAVVPSWRRDIAIEADVIEELARVIGYDRVPATLPSTAMPPHRPSPLATRDALRRILAGHGLNEVVTHALVAQRSIDAWHWSEPAPPASGEAAAGGLAISVTNPLSLDHSVLRQGLVGGLVDTIVLNRRRGRDDVSIFEVGKGYGRTGSDPHEWWRLGIALAGAFDVPGWNRARRVADLDDAKGLISAVCAAVGGSEPAYRPTSVEGSLHPGRAAIVSSVGPEGTIVVSGVVGEVHPAAAAAWDERASGAILAELSVQGLSGGQLPVARGVAPSRHPGVERDIAAVVGPGTTAADIANVIRDSAGGLLLALGLFDVYRGTPLAGDERSLAYRMSLGAADRTLTEAEVEEVMDRVTAAIIALGGRIRG